MQCYWLAVFLSARRLAELGDGADVSRPPQQPGDPQVEAESGGGVGRWRHLTATSASGHVDLVHPDPTCPQGASSSLNKTIEWVFGHRASSGLPLLESLGNKHQVEPSKEKEESCQSTRWRRNSAPLWAWLIILCWPPSLSIQHRSCSHLVKIYGFIHL